MFAIRNDSIKATEASGEPRMQPVEDKTSAVSRRAALGFAAAAVTLGAATARAEEGMDHSQMDHSKMDHSGMDHSMHGTKHKALIDTASACIAKGEVCVAHCMDLIKGGDTAMVECMKTVSIMMPMCAALVRLAAMDAKRLKELTAVCKDVCADCEAECKKHAEKHAVCKACMDSCTACIKECKALLDS
jgi:Cys-rich four helix bundle protein (predicted Tat secretion target)